jgi:RNA 2',3'-cyclic 3'-phosphodiesterase
MARDLTSRPEATPLRLFVAVDVPPAVKDRLAATIAPYRDRVPARWASEAGWHVTMKFLGSTWPRMVDAVREAVREAAGRVGPFETRLTDVGVFPSVRRARVVWAGLDDDAGSFAALAGALDELLADVVEPERRPFTPHLTLARMNPSRDVSEFAPDLVGRSVASDPFAVDRLVLYRSHLSPRGARYEPLDAHPLGAAGARVLDPERTFE